MKHSALYGSPQPEFEHPELYINRELSWIEFNRRVFEQAQDSRHPLLERVKFISIFETNLDEFMMIRVAGLRDQSVAFPELRSPDGRTAKEQLHAVRERLAPFVQDVRRYWRQELLPLLAEQHIHILDYEQLDDRQRSAMRLYFENEVFPVLTPLAVDPFHPFPHISNRSLNLAVVLTNVQQGDLFARVKVPPTLPRLVPVPVASEVPEAVAFVWIEQVIAANISKLFPGFEIWESYPFRVLRDADIELQEDEASDLFLEHMAQGVRERRFGTVVDMAVNPSMPARVRTLLLDNLEIDEKDLLIIDGSLGLGDVLELYHLDRPFMKYEPLLPRIPSFLHNGSDLFAAIQQKDLLLHHPYDTFNSVVDFIRAAANDPQVLAIKQTLYRVGGANAPIVNALLEAVENGKQVAVLVELKARFDEEHNIVWARELERAGVHVVYGISGLKTHAKIALVVRREGEGLRRYVHLGTGNYNATTAKTYEDLGLLTCLPAIGADASDLFNSLTGYSRQNSYRKLLVAPRGLRRGIVERIEREIRLHREYGDGHLIFKINALTDPGIIYQLYKASQAGVRVELLMRSICSLRPGVPAVSDNIYVRSLVGRFLEHSRIYYFRNNGDEEVYLGSADMMQRNLNRRVEILFPLESSALRTAVRQRVLDPLLADTVNTQILSNDGTYTGALPEPGKEPFDSQEWFMIHPLVQFEEAEGEDLGTTINTVSSNV